MYATTSEALNYIRRVASHATKESPTGRIDAVPWWAERPKEWDEESVVKETKVLGKIERDYQKFLARPWKGSHRENRWFVKIQDAIKSGNKKEQEKWELIWINYRLNQSKAKQLYQMRLKMCGGIKPKAGWGTQFPKMKHLKAIDGKTGKYLLPEQFEGKQYAQQSANSNSQPITPHSSKDDF